jgi:hypothetical protein
VVREHNPHEFASLPHALLTFDVALLHALAMTSTTEPLSTAEVCERLGRPGHPLDKSTISRWVQLGRLTPVKRIGRAMLFAPADVEQLRAELAKARAELAAKAAG